VPPPELEAAATVLLSGWRLWLAWGLMIVFVGWNAVLGVLSIPVWHKVSTDVLPVFQALHLSPNWSEGPGVGRYPGGLAVKAGLPSGTLLAIDGQPVGEGTSVFEAADRLRGPLGESIRLTVRGDSATVTTTLERSAPPWGDGLSPVLVRFVGMLFMSVVFILGGLALLWRGGRSLVALLGATTFLCLGLYGYSTDLEVLVGGWWNHPVVKANGLVVVFLLFPFLALFPDGRVRPRWAWAILLLAVLILAQNVVPDGYPLGVRLFLLVSVFSTLLAAHIVRHRRYATDEQRQQTKWAVLGIAVFVALILVLAVVGPLVPEERLLMREVVFTIGSLGLIALVAGVVISLLRYRLWDAESAWSRSAMAAALTLALTAIIAGGTALAQSVFGAGGPLALGLATAAAAVLFVPLQNRLSDWADHRFLRDLTDLRERLPQLVGHLRETESIDGLAEAVVDRIAPVVHATQAALVMPDGDGGWTVAGVAGIEPADVAAWAASVGLARPPATAPRRKQPWRAIVWAESSDRTFPVRIALRSERAGGEMATEGWLALGPRPDGSGYGPDDLEAVAEVAGPVARALQVVRVRENHDALLAQRDASLAAQLAALHNRLEALQTQLRP
jgi:hypothetical protein